MIENTHSRRVIRAKKRHKIIQMVRQNKRLIDNPRVKMKKKNKKMMRIPRVNIKNSIIYDRVRTASFTRGAVYGAKSTPESTSDRKAVGTYETPLLISYTRY